MHVESAGQGLHEWYLLHYFFLEHLTLVQFCLKNTYFHFSAVPFNLSNVLTLSPALGKPTSAGQRRRARTLLSSEVALEHKVIQCVGS